MSKDGSDRWQNYLLAALPLLPSGLAFLYVQESALRSKIVTSGGISVLGFVLTSYLVQVVAEYTLRKGLSGKDMGKKGSASESTDVPEALGIVSGTVFLICTIASQLTFAQSSQELVVYNSALFSM